MTPTEPPSGQQVADDYAAYAVRTGDGACRLELAVEGITCAACLSDIERGLKRVPGVLSARVNVSNRRTSVVFSPEHLSAADVVARMAAIGYPAQPFDPALVRENRSAAARELLKAMGVAAFGATNVMLMSIAVWSGNVTDITAETRDFFHLMSMIVAVPTVGYAIRPFLRGAIAALRRGSLSMDVPISLGVLLAMGLSIFNTLTHALEAYFDSALMLLFFLLLGRYLDEAMRRRTAVEAETLAALKADHAVRRAADGSLSRVPLGAVSPGDEVVVAPGDKVPVDGTVLAGRSELDMSLVTGETLPVAVAEGDRVHAGTVNGAGLLVVTTTAVGEGTLLAEIERLIAEAQSAKGSAQRLADRAARLYAPLVHGAALLTLLGWLAAGAGWNVALVNAIAVLIITCPCALALAVPAVQVTAAGRFFRNGILVNAGDAIERFAHVDVIVFDKTGTLTEPVPDLLDREAIDPEVLEAAGRLALASRHPLAAALARAAGARVPVDEGRESPGEGVVATVDGHELRLGSPAFCGMDPAVTDATLARHAAASVLAFSDDAGRFAVFAFGQRLRTDARATIAHLGKSGYRLEILSGDRPEAVAEAAAALDIADWRGGVDPAAKIARLRALADEGHKVLMVGDGLNDAPSLAAAHVSLSPVTAVHVAQAAADAVFLGRGLGSVAVALEVSKRGYRLMVENLVFAALYNAVAVPVAVLGHVTPLVAALAMSASSMIVTANALRLRRVAEPSAKQVADAHPGAGDHLGKAAR